MGSRARRTTGRKAVSIPARKGKLKTSRRSRGRPRSTAEAIENARLELIGVYAVCDLVRSQTGLSTSIDIVLTRGAIEPLRRALELLGQEDAYLLMWPGRRDALSARFAAREAT